MSKKLEHEVWEVERCAGCGACVAACSKRILSFAPSADRPSKERVSKAIGLSNKDVDTCEFCALASEILCEESCPRLLATLEEGGIIRAVSARTTRKDKSGQMNDVITDLLIGTFQTAMLDGVLLMDIDRWTLKPRSKIATSIADLVESAGHQYIWFPLLEVLNEAIYERNLKNIAIVGTPCVIQAVKRMKESKLPAMASYKDAIRLTIGLFCPGIYSPEIIGDELLKRLNIPKHELKGIEQSIKDNKMYITLSDGTKKDVPLSEVQRYFMKGCARCDDYLAGSADISIGTVGAKDGYSTVMVRTEAGETALSLAENRNLLDLDKKVNMEEIKKAKEEKDKRKRTQMFDSLKIVMLDALSDASKVEEAKKRFGELYELGKAGPHKEKGGYNKAGCGTCSLC